ncbi:alpha-protein kinase 3 isoform X2 [Denticeps clupeoides]|uniref:non-specific serine/threonine protein kinase n=1 Tax=Denticeps clupeoides TaxID=299321 RepID=A0AAY4C1I4_9TELE|nr:alpha-protein kinase 3 isoform X2 [Denticeps clupeoides]
MTSRRPMTRSYSGNGRSNSQNGEEMSSPNVRADSRNYLSSVRPENRSTFCSVMSQLTEETQPSFETTLKSKAVSESCNVKFTCVVTGYPAPEITWYKDDAELDRYCGLPKYEIFHSGKSHTLHIYNCTLDDAAIYQASARNNKGIVSCSGVLEVGDMNEYKIHQRFFAKLKQKAENKRREQEESRRRGKENIQQEQLNALSQDRILRKRRSPGGTDPLSSPPSAQEEEEPITTQEVMVVENPVDETNGAVVGKTPDMVKENQDSNHLPNGVEIISRSSPTKEKMSKKKIRISNGFDEGTVISSQSSGKDKDTNSEGISLAQYLTETLQSQAREESARLHETMEVDSERQHESDKEHAKVRERLRDEERQREKERERLRESEQTRDIELSPKAESKRGESKHSAKKESESKSSITSVFYSLKDIFFGKNKKDLKAPEDSKGSHQSHMVSEEVLLPTSQIRVTQPDIPSGVNNAIPEAAVTMEVDEPAGLHLNKELAQQSPSPQEEPVVQESLGLSNVHGVTFINTDSDTAPEKASEDLKHLSEQQTEIPGDGKNKVVPTSSPPMPFKATDDHTQTKWHETPVLEDSFTGPLESEATDFVPMMNQVAEDTGGIPATVEGQQEALPSGQGASDLESAASFTTPSEMSVKVPVTITTMEPMAQEDLHVEDLKLHERVNPVPIDGQEKGKSEITDVGSVLVDQYDIDEQYMESADSEESNGGMYLEKNEETEKLVEKKLSRNDQPFQNTYSPKEKTLLSPEMEVRTEYSQENILPIPTLLVLLEERHDIGVDDQAKKSNLPPQQSADLEEMETEESKDLLEHAEVSSHGESTIVITPPNSQSEIVTENAGVLEEAEKAMPEIKVVVSEEPLVQKDVETETPDLALEEAPPMRVTLDEEQECVNVAVNCFTESEEVLRPPAEAEEHLLDKDNSDSQTWTHDEGVETSHSSSSENRVLALPAENLPTTPQRAPGNHVTTLSAGIQEVAQQSQEQGECDGQEPAEISTGWSRKKDSSIPMISISPTDYEVTSICVQDTSPDTAPATNVEIPKTPVFDIPPISVSCVKSTADTSEGELKQSLTSILRGVKETLDNESGSVKLESPAVEQKSVTSHKEPETQVDQLQKDKPVLDKLAVKPPVAPTMSPSSLRRLLAKNNSSSETALTGDPDKKGEDSGGSTPTSSLSCESSPKLRRRDSLTLIRSATPEELASGARRKIYLSKMKDDTEGSLDNQGRKDAPYMSPNQARRAAFLQAQAAGQQTPPMERRSPLLSRRKATLEVPKTQETPETTKGTKPTEQDKQDPFKAPQVIRKIRGEPFSDATGHLKLWCQFFNVLSDSFIKWYRDEVELLEVKRSAGDESPFALAIVQASSRDCGVYTCTIKNDYGSDTTDFLLSPDILTELLLKEDTEAGEEIEMTPLLFTKGLADSGYWGNKFFGRIITQEMHLGESCVHKTCRVKVIYGLDPIFESGSMCIIKVRNPIAYGTKEENSLIERNQEIIKQECKVQNTLREYCKIFAAEARVIENFGFALEVIPVYLMYRPANTVPYATVEADLKGVYLRYCLIDASGRLISRTTSEVEQKCCTFQHWIHQWTNGNLLATQIEGVDSKITNIRIATKSKGYQGLTEEASPKMLEQFLTQHQCNYYCGLLGLRPLKSVDSLQQPAKMKGSRSPLLNRKVGTGSSSPQLQKKGLSSPQMAKKSSTSPKVARKTGETEDTNAPTKHKTVEIPKTVRMR